MRSKDTQLMKEIKEYVEGYALSHMGNMPIYAEIAERFNISCSSVFRYLKDMDEKEHMITCRDGIIRTEKLDRFSRNVCAVYDEGVSAGIPYDVEDNATEYFTIPASFVNGQNGRFFTVKVSGESMIDAGIEPGDIIICQVCSEAKTEDIVVAYIRGEGATLKRLRRDKEGLFLWAENNSWSMDDRMIGRAFEIQGKVIKILKDI